MKKIGMIVAMDSEIRPFLDNISSESKTVTYGIYSVTMYESEGNFIYLVKSGIGEIHAASATQLLIDKYSVDVVINFGVVGSLATRFEIGKAVFMDGVVHYDYDTTPIDPTYKIGQYGENEGPVFKFSNKYTELLKKLYPEIPFVVCASGDKFVSKNKIRKHLNKTYGASICDMESAAIYMVSRNNDVPCVFIKAVSDSKTGDFKEGLKIASVVVADLIKDLLKNI